MGDRRRGAGLVATSLGFGVVQLDVSIVNVALRTIGGDLHGSTAALQWVVGAYTITFAALILIAGAFGDRIGAKRVFLTGFVVFGATSGVCGLAPTLGVLIAARALQGVGAAMLVPCSLSLLTRAYPEGSERAKAVGLWAAGASVALSAGPLIGGVLTATLGWRAIFVINVPLAVVAIVLCTRFSAENPADRRRRLDVPGAALAALALAITAFAVISGGRAGFGAPGVLIGIGAGAAIGVLFVLVEARRSAPMLPLDLFAAPAFAASAAVGLLVNIAFYGLIFVLGLFFQQAQHLSVLATGLAFAPLTIAVLVANLTAGRVVDRFGGGPVVLAGAVLMLAGLLPLTAADSGTAFAALVLPFVALGAGLGAIVPAMTTALLSSVDAARSGIASGTLNSARQVGSFLGVAILGALGSGSTTSGLRLSAAASIALLLATAGLALVVGRSGGPLASGLTEAGIGHPADPGRGRSASRLGRSSAP